MNIKNNLVKVLYLLLFLRSNTVNQMSEIIVIGKAIIKQNQPRRLGEYVAILYFGGIKKNINDKNRLK